MKKMLNSFRSATLLLAGVIALGACNDLLDLTPNQSIKTETAFTSPQHVKAALAGAYDRFSSGNLMGGYLGIYSDLLGNNGDVTFRGTFQDLRNANTRTMTANDALAAVPWTSGYNMINSVNEVIAGASEVFADDAATRRQYIAEARFLRGIVFFELVRMYGKAYNDGDPAVNPGIPLVFAPSRSENDTLVHKLPRASVQAVFDSALSDLKYAATNLGTNVITGSQDGGREMASVRAANAYLSRIYLTMSATAAPREKGVAINAAALAQTYATNVLGGVSASFRLADRYSDLWTTGRLGNEDILGLTVSNQDGVNNFCTFYSGYSRRDMQVNNTFLNRFEATTDARRQAGVMIWTYLARQHSKKWDDINNADVKIIRLAEVYLNRAEAALRLATPDTAQARADIDVIRTRAGRPVFAVQFPGQTVTLAAVRLERYRELSFEGHWLHDAKRFQETIRTVPWNSDRNVMPIPIREIEVNQNLVQNPGYGT